MLSLCFLSSSCVHKAFALRSRGWRERTRRSRSRRACRVRAPRNQLQKPCLPGTLCTETAVLCLLFRSSGVHDAAAQGRIFPTVLRISYAMSGIDIGYAAMRRSVLA
eukprot:1509616-Rhodomonas_salina.1